MNEHLKVVGRPFRPGVSGNPGGRPRELRDVTELARSHSPEAIETLVEIMNDETAPPQHLPRRGLRPRTLFLTEAMGSPLRPWTPAFVPASYRSPIGSSRAGNRTWLSLTPRMRD